MNKKVLGGALAGIMAVSIVPTTASATTSVDALYKVAHTATTKAMKSNNQTDINAARNAIKVLPKKLDWARGEFSKQLDKVQHPILKTIIDAINVASTQEGLRQANINVIFNSIPVDLPTAYKVSYSSARDTLQMKFQDKVVASVKLAEEKKTEDAKLGAQILVNELKTAVSSNVAKVAKETLQARLDAIVLDNNNNNNNGNEEDNEEDVIVKDIKVTDASQFNSTSITVEFEKLEKDIAKVTVEVKKPNGAIIEVTPLNLKKGQTTATFKFIEPIEGKFKSGLWTVDNVKFNALNMNFLNVFANLENDDINGMGQLLKDYEVDLKIGNVEHLAECYKAYLEVPSRDKVSSIKDVQDVINEGNLNVDFPIE